MTYRPSSFSNSFNLSFPSWLYSASDQEPEAVCNPLYNALTSNLPKLLELVFTPAFYSPNLDMFICSGSECALIETSLTTVDWSHSGLLVAVLRILGI